MTFFPPFLPPLLLQPAKQLTVYETVNPKSINTDELYGYMTLTKDWKDGVLSIIMRDMTKNTSPFSSYQTNKWVVLDGDIDAGEWTGEKRRVRLEGEEERRGCSKHLTINTHTFVNIFLSHYYIWYCS